MQWTWTIKLIRLVLKITKCLYLGQDAWDGLPQNHYHCVKNHQSAAQFGYRLHEIRNGVREF